MNPSEFSLLDFVQHPLFAVAPDADGALRYVAFNPTSEKATGRRKEDVLGKTALDVFAGETGEILHEHHRHALMSEQPVTYETILPYKSELRRTSVTLTPKRDARGQVQYLLGSSEVIADVDIVADMEARARQIVRDSEHFVSQAAHDLRTPMRHVSTIADMLNEDLTGGTPEAQELVEQLRLLGTKSLDLISDILTHNEVSGTAEQLATFDIAVLVDDIMTVLDPFAQAKITVSRALLRGDKAGTQIVLRNLIDNALKHASPGEGRRVELQISATSVEHGLFEVSVSDNGTGLESPQQILQARGGSTVEGGYGLRGVQRLVQARGGRIAASKMAFGSGTCVRFSLPGSVQTSPSVATLSAARA